MAVRTWKKRIVATFTSAMLAICTSCSEAALGDAGDTDDEEALDFRAGGPEPAAVANEVAQLRAQQLVLGPTTSVGTLRGDAGVSPRGSGGYTIPIEVTPGPRGMQPSLSVVYDSNGDGGALGHRFDLSGVSSIRRCTANVADDGAYAPLHFDDTDPLCMGDRRLVLAAGVHGKTGAEYRTQEDPFARIVLHDDIAELGGTITVEDGTGRVTTYGTAPASLWIGQTSGTVTPWLWSVLRSCDSFANCIDYEYEHGPDLGNGPTDHRLMAVRYGGTGVPASRRSVVFSWIARTDVVTKYMFGAERREAKVLDRITVNGPQAAVVRSYRFTYAVNAQSGRTRLQSARLCDAAGVCLPATTFAWTEDAQPVLARRDWQDGDGLAEQQAAFLRSRETIIGDFDGLAGDELLFRSDDPDEPWLMWFRAPPDDPEQDGGPTTALPPLENILPPEPVSGNGSGFFSVGAYRQFLERNTPGFAASAVDFNGDVRDDLLIPVRGGWPDADGGLDEDGIAFAQQFMIAANVDGSNFSTYYIDDGSNDPIYQIVPLDHDGDFYTDVWMCRGPNARQAHWVFAQHHGGPAGTSFGYDFHESEIGCSVYDEYTISSVDGGPASLLVIAAREDDGTAIPEPNRGSYRRLRFDPQTSTTTLEGTGLPRDRYQRMHDRQCRNAADEASFGGTSSSAGPGLDRHIDINMDGLPDVLRFELATGDGSENDAIDDGMLTAPNDIAARLDGSDWRDVSLCGASDDLTQDAVLAVYYNTGAGYVRGSDALELEDNAHAQLWLNVVGGATYDLDDDGRLDLLMPATGPGTQWTQLAVDATGVFSTQALALGDEWPAYDDDDTWRDDLETASRMRVFTLGNGGGDRPDLVLAGVLEESETFPYWVNVFLGKGAGAKNRVETITDGLGAQTHFEYEAAASPVTPYTEWPKAPLRAALWVVSSIEETSTENETDGNHDVVAEATRIRSYDYFDAAVDRRGRGFLGFGRVRVSNGGIVTLTTYDQSYVAGVDGYPALGRPVEREVATGDHVDRDLWTWTTYPVPQTGGMTSFVYAGTHRRMARQLADGCDIENTCDYDASKVYRDMTTTETRDEFGTLLTSVEWPTEGGGPITQVDQTEIVHDTDAWLLHQVGRVTVQTCDGGLCAGCRSDRDVGRPGIRRQGGLSVAS